MTPSHNYEIENLKNKVSALKEELSNSIEYYECLVNTICPNIQATYISTIGKYKLERLKIELQVRRLKRKIDLIRSFINRGEQPDFTLIENTIAEEYKSWEAEVKEFSLEFENSIYRLDNLLSIEDSNEVKRLYRAIAKKLHPDINPDQTLKMQLLWYRAYEAYQKNDIEELKNILLLIEDEVELPENDAIVELTNKINNLSNAIADYDAMIKGKIESYPFILKTILDDPAKTENEINLEKVQIEQLHKLYEHYNYLLQMMGYKDDEQHYFN